MEIKTIPCFYIRDIPIHRRVALSPMAGVSDSPHRKLARSFGSGWSVSEFVSDEQILIGNPKTFDLFRYEEVERPVAFQIFGFSVDTLTQAALRIRELNPDIIDLNMGCSTHKVSLRGSGAGLLRNLPLAGKIMESLRKNLDIPITAKIRIGWDQDSLNYKETLKVLEGSGAEAIAVHGRTRDMAYTGYADWDVIGEMKSLAKVPIIGNGDITQPTDVGRRLEETGVDAVFIGRGAIGNPWIFSGINKENNSYSEIHSVAWFHYQDMKLFYSEENAYRLFKKYFKKYTVDFPDPSNFRDKILRAENCFEFEENWLMFREYFSKQDDNSQEEKEEEGKKKAGYQPALLV